jgi:RNA polymerase sigma-70 factor (ECF subfamily)
VAVTADEFQRRPAQAAEQAAWFEAAFNEHWARVYGVLFRLVGEQAEAEDLALEVFWRLYSRPPRSADNLGGWLYRVAANLGLNALRARKRRKGYEQQAGQEAVSLTYPLDPGEQAERAEQRRLVQAALAKLKPRSAQALVLRHSGLSYAEIATALNLPASSVGTLLARAEEAFEKAYREIGGEKDAP